METSRVSFGTKLSIESFPAEQLRRALRIRKDRFPKQLGAAKGVMTKNRVKDELSFSTIERFGKSLVIKAALKAGGDSAEGSIQIPKLFFRRSLAAGFKEVYRHLSRALARATV